MKCKYCGNEMIVIGEQIDEYGSNKYSCKNCGAKAEEVFGHGVLWTAGRWFVL